MDRDMHPNESVRQLLYELCERYGVRICPPRLHGGTAAEEHFREHGHVLSFGCCAEGAQEAVRPTD